MRVPVVGLGETTLHWAAQLGRNMALVSIDHVFERWHLEQADLYGLSGRVSHVSALGVVVEDFAAAFGGDAAAYGRMLASFRALVEPLVAAGADVIVPAGALPGLLLRREVGLTIGHAPVVNCVAVTLKATEAWVRVHRLTGLEPSRGPSFALAPSGADRGLPSVRRPRAGRRGAMSGAVLVVGATGMLGGRVCRLLLQRGEEVRGLVRPGTSPATRDALSAAGVHTVAGDLERPDTLTSALYRVDTVVSTASSFPVDPRPDAIARVDRDGQVALVEAAGAAGVRRFVYLSFPPYPIAFPFQDAKRAVEARLRSSNLEAVVLQPGKFMDVWFSPPLGFDVAAGHVRLYGGGTAPVSWVAVGDVAEVTAQAVRSPVAAGRTFAFGGPEALAQREVVRSVRGPVGSYVHGRGRARRGARGDAPRRRDPDRDLARRDPPRRDPPRPPRRDRDAGGVRLRADQRRGVRRDRRLIGTAADSR